jgi:hypothetical protein
VLQCCATPSLCQHVHEALANCINSEVIRNTRVLVLLVSFKETEVLSLINKRKHCAQS